MPFAYLLAKIPDSIQCYYLLLTTDQPAFCTSAFILNSQLAGMFLYALLAGVSLYDDVNGFS